MKVYKGYSKSNVLPELMPVIVELAKESGVNVVASSTLIIKKLAERSVKISPPRLMAMLGVLASQGEIEEIEWHKKYGCLPMYKLAERK